MKQGKKPLLVAADIYRPAAVDQLKVLGQKLDVPVFHEADTKPPEMCAARRSTSADAEAATSSSIDTAGRLAIDEEMMSELEQIKARVQPENILLVADAMIGQDAVQDRGRVRPPALADGFVLTKLDGDARGGAALCIKEVTGKPIKFLGMGEGWTSSRSSGPKALPAASSASATSSG